MLDVRNGEFPLLAHWGPLVVVRRRKEQGDPLRGFRNASNQLEILDGLQVFPIVFERARVDVTALAVPAELRIGRFREPLRPIPYRPCFVGGTRLVDK